MTLSQFHELLNQHPHAALHFVLPAGDLIPAHFHVTEVGRIQKDFIDCGGTTRSEIACRLQIWVASDTDHRLNSTKLGSILNLAEKLFPAVEVPIEVEYEGEAISQYPIAYADVAPRGLVFQLGSKHTDCLAKDKCGVPLASAEGCAVPGCC